MDPLNRTTRHWDTPRERVGAKVVFALLGAAFQWAITRIAPTQCAQGANLLWSDLVLIEAHATELRAFGAQRIGVFGSFAREEATAESDVDVYLELSDKAFRC